MSLKRRFQIFVVLALLIHASFVVKDFYFDQYPYGSSHSCDIGVWITLLNYAQNHGGNFPAGEATPEASLSLLYRDGSADAEYLRGKTVPAEKVKEILERGELLTPETCGWHYVEGLRNDDDSRLAILWDKAGLGHNGQRHKGYTTVLRINTGRDSISDDEWDEFVKEQERLLAEVLRKRPNAKIRQGDDPPPARFK